jgi:hypothetical protein
MTPTIQSYVIAKPNAIVVPTNTAPPRARQCGAVADPAVSRSFPAMSTAALAYAAPEVRPGATIRTRSAPVHDHQALQRLAYAATDVDDVTAVKKSASQPVISQLSPRGLGAAT